MVDLNIVQRELVKHVASGEMTLNEANVAYERATSLYVENNNDTIKEKFETYHDEVNVMFKTAQARAAGGDYKGAKFTLNECKKKGNELKSDINSLESDDITVGLARAVLNAVKWFMLGATSEYFHSIKKRLDPDKAPKIDKAVSKGIVASGIVQISKIASSLSKNGEIDLDEWNDYKKEILKLIDKSIDEIDDAIIEVERLEKSDKEDSDDKDVKEMATLEAAYDYMHKYLDIVEEKNIMIAGKEHEDNVKEELETSLDKITSYRTKYRDYLKAGKTEEAIGMLEKMKAEIKNSYKAIYDLKPTNGGISALKVAGNIAKSAATGAVAGALFIHAKANMTNEYIKDTTGIDFKAPKPNAKKTLKSAGAGAIESIIVDSAIKLGLQLSRTGKINAAAFDDTKKKATDTLRRIEKDINKNIKYLKAVKSKPV